MDGGVPPYTFHGPALCLESRDTLLRTSLMILVLVLEVLSSRKYHLRHVRDDDITIVLLQLFIQQKESNQDR